MRSRNSPTDVSQLGILFQLVARPIPWDQIELPPGRTLKAVQVMIDKEKSKLKKANAENGTPAPNTPATGKGKGTGGKAKSAGKVCLQPKFSTIDCHMITDRCSVPRNAAPTL
jgi:hypothetical protein